MSLSKPVMNLSTLLLQIVPWIAAQPNKLRKNSKIHDYTPYVAGTDYIFETSDNGMTGYMTAQGKGIKPGDYIILQNVSQFYKYQVEQIDYYSNPSDMWMASLKLIPEVS